MINFKMYVLFNIGLISKEELQFNNLLSEEVIPSVMSLDGKKYAHTLIKD